MGRIVLFAVLLAALLPACGETEPTAPPRPDDAYSRATRFDFIGVVPGAYVRGRSIHADGRYEVWSRKHDGPEATRTLERTRKVPPEAVSAFFDALRTAGFLELEATSVDQQNEYATGMELHGPEGAHAVWWVKSSDAPRNLRNITNTMARWEHGLR